MKNFPLGSKVWFKQNPNDNMEVGVIIIESVGQLQKGTDKYVVRPETRPDIRWDATPDQLRPRD